MGIFTMNYRGIISLLVLFNRIPYLKTIYWRKNLSIWWCMAKYIWIEVMQISTISSHLYKSTFATHGQVVSTIWTFFSLKVNISSTAAPKAGNMTTSPLLTTSNCFPLSSYTWTQDTDSWFSNTWSLSSWFSFFFNQSSSHGSCFLTFVWFRLAHCHPKRYSTHS